MGHNQSPLTILFGNKLWVVHPRIERNSLRTDPDTEREMGFLLLALHYPQHHVLCGCSEDWPHFDPCKSRIRLWWKHNACSSNSQGDFSHRCVLTQSQAETEAGLWANVRRMAPKAGTPFVTAANVSLTAESFWCLEKGWLFCRTEELIIVKGKLPHLSLSDCFTLEMTRVTEKEREKFNGVIEKRKSSLMERSRNLLG